MPRFMRPTGAVLGALLLAAAACDSAEPPLPPVTVVTPPPASLRKLVTYQYQNAILDLLGPEAAAASTAPVDNAVSGFDTVGAAQLSLNDGDIERYEDSALIAVATAFEQDPAGVTATIGCDPVSETDMECMRDFVTRFGRRAFRRPLSELEISRYLAVASDGMAYANSFYTGVFMVMAGMLQSPHFLYMAEVGESDPAHPERRKLTSYEMATRLSFFLLGTTPDEALLDIAANGGLDSAAQVREVALSLIERPEARAALDVFHSELFGLRDLANLVKVPAAFPDLASDVAEPVNVGDAFSFSARGETLGLVRDIVWDRQADYRELIVADYTMSNAVTDLLYFGTPIPPNADINDYGAVSLPPEQGRSGILTHTSLLSLQARSTRTSPTLRGRFIRQALLCDSIPPPPDDVSFELPSDTEAPTLREKMKQHQENPGCAGCHALMDDLGFALESFDGLGFYRTSENGYPLDTSADLPDLGAFNGAQEMGAALFASPKLPACTVRRLFRFATGHVETSGESSALNAITNAYATSGYRFKSLMAELVSSEAFRYVGAIEE